MKRSWSPKSWCSQQTVMEQSPRRWAGKLSRKHGGEEEKEEKKKSNYSVLNYCQTELNDKIKGRAEKQFESVLSLDAG